MKKQAPLQRKDALKGKSFLLQQIEHGDFNYSNYKSQAEDELVRATTEKAALLKNWKASKESYNEACHEIDRKYRKRYNKLMEDHLNEETKLLSVLKKRLILEFKNKTIDGKSIIDYETELSQYNKKSLDINKYKIISKAH